MALKNGNISINTTDRTLQKTKTIVTYSNVKSIIPDILKCRHVHATCYYLHYRLYVATEIKLLHPYTLHISLNFIGHMIAPRHMNWFLKADCILIILCIFTLSRYERYVLAEPCSS